MNSISLKLPESLLERVKAEARDRRVSQSVVICDCLSEMLSRPKDGKKPSCLDLMGDLVGSQRGPKDLASNKAYLQGLGRERSRHH